MKCLQAVAVTSSLKKRLDIFFDEKTGLIIKVQDAVLSKDLVDFYYSDDVLLFPGMGDIHIHAREDVSLKNTYKETFASACCAAVNGGIVHMADMPNNPIPPVDDKSYFGKWELAKEVKLPILLYAGIGPKTRPLSFKVPYKVYMGPSIGELFFKDDQTLEDSLGHYHRQCVSFHCEDPEILEANKAQLTHEKRRPIVAEKMATQTALRLIEKFQLKGKLCHYSAGEGLALIKDAKTRGVDVTCEVTPQHLYYSIEKLEMLPKEERILFQMNPPIRGEEDRLALLNALKRGEIDFLATDHAPHSPQEKQNGMSGLPGLDTYGPFVTWLILNEKVAPEMIAKVASEGPGRFINQFIAGETGVKLGINAIWGKGFGFLLPGFSASFTLLNLNRPITIKQEDLKTKAGWSPFLGVTFPGSVEDLFFQGKKL